MQSRAILFSIIISAFVLLLGMVKVDLHNIMPFKVTYNSLNEHTQRQVTCLAENIYFEAGYEPDEGKKAVAFVTLNRVLTGNYAEDICGVVHQKTGRTCQFSWYCDKKFTDRRLTIKDSPLYNDIRDMATNIVVNFDKMRDVTEGSTYYHADYVKPNWKMLDKVNQIGRHIFYKRKGDEIDRNREFF
jgi:spore germination cell wall hydrolase CwlJ-like protein